MSDIRVRFCPSPTGVPHVGLMRTALFNWAYARHFDGKFIFRIEDTDKNRNSTESYEQLIKAMKWLQLDWDEGVEVGGPNGPYRQSDRYEIYQDVIHKLLSEGYVYRSYSTPDEVELRHRAAGRNPKLGYDNYDRQLTKKQISDFQLEGRKGILRIYVPQEDITFKDLVRGEISFKVNTISDYAITRANGDPLYTLVNPVDDALMRITHVLRGEDLLSSTPRQIVLHNILIKCGLSTKIPKFGHLPYIIGKGNKKLSKRDQEAELFSYKEKGFIPEGLLNYLSLLGWSLSSKRDIFNINEMIQSFDIKNVIKNPARFDIKKAEAINFEHLKRLNLKDYRNALIPHLQNVGILSKNISDQDIKILNSAIPLLKERITLLEQASNFLSFLFIDDKEVKIDKTPISKISNNLLEILDIGVVILKRINRWNSQDIHKAFRVAFIEERDMKPRNAFSPFRLALTGKTISLPLFESMEILGKKSTLTRIEKFRKNIEEFRKNTALGY